MEMLDEYRRCSPYNEAFHSLKYYATFLKFIKKHYISFINMY